MLKGELTTTPIEVALSSLANEQATGCLHVVDDAGSEALIYLKAGLVYAVSVPGQRPQLGARLISSNALVPENLAEALEAQRTELQGWRLGELLVHLGFVEQDVVEAFVQEQVRDGMTDLLAWTSGRWRFRKGEKTREDVAPPTPLAELFDQVSARKSTWEEIVDAVHGPNAVPMLAAHGGEAHITLDSDTWSLLCKIDGERSIADLARECGFTLFEAGTVVRVLVEAGSGRRRRRHRPGRRAGVRRRRRLTTLRTRPTTAGRGRRADDADAARRRRADARQLLQDRSPRGRLRSEWPRAGR